MVHGLAAAGSTPLTSTATNREQPAGSAISTECPGPAGGIEWAATSVNGTSYPAASSRASPRMDSAYPRSGVIANSITVSSDPMRILASEPISPASWPGPASTRMPSCSVPMPNSLTEQIIPSEILP